MEGKNQFKKDIFDDVYMFSLIIVLLSIVICGLWENSIIKRYEGRNNGKDKKGWVLSSFQTKPILVKFSLNEVKNED